MDLLTCSKRRTQAWNLVKQGKLILKADTLYKFVGLFFTQIQHTLLTWSVGWLVRPSMGWSILGDCEKVIFTRVQEYQILTHYPVVPTVVGTTSSGDMTGFDDSGEYSWYEWLSSFCRTFRCISNLLQCECCPITYIFSTDWHKQCDIKKVMSTLWH